MVGLLVALSLVCAIYGVGSYRQLSPSKPLTCTHGAILEPCISAPPYRLHTLRAEILGSAAVVFAVSAFGIVVTGRRRWPPHLSNLSVG